MRRRLRKPCPDNHAFHRPPRASHWPRTAVSRPPPLGRLDGGVGFGGFLFCIGGGCSMLWAAQSAPTGSICGDCLSAASHQNPLSRIQQPFSGPTIEFFRPSRPLRDRCNGEGCRLGDVCVPSGMYSASVHSHAASRSRGRGRIRPAKSKKTHLTPLPIGGPQDTQLPRSGLKNRQPRVLRRVPRCQ